MTKCGYVAIIGAPNAGKSTLLNQVVGSKLAIVTPKVQTTRNRILGITAEAETQLVFMDTPGIFQANKKFERAMVDNAWSGAADADIVLLLADAKKGMDAQLTEICEALGGVKQRKVLALNKTDLVKKPALLEMAAALDSLGLFERIFMISALEGDGVEDLRRWLADEMPEGAWLFPEDQMSDIPMRLLASEITREKLFFQLQQELPYSVMVETESWEERQDGAVTIRQVIYVERESQKKIVLGNKGAMIKKIGAVSRHEMEVLWGRAVHLFLFVKVKPDWKNQPEMYSYLGLEFKG